MRLNDSRETIIPIGNIVIAQKSVVSYTIIITIKDTEYSLYYTTDSKREADYVRIAEAIAEER